MGLEQRMTQRLIWIWDFWFCFDRFGRRGKTFPVNTIAGMDSHSLFPSSNRNLYCVLSWAPEKLSIFTHLAQICWKGKKIMMPSVFLPSFYSIAPVSCSHFVTQSCKYKVILLGLFEDNVHHKRRMRRWCHCQEKKKKEEARLSQSPTFPGVRRSQISSSLAQLWELTWLKCMPDFKTISNSFCETV